MASGDRVGATGLSLAGLPSVCNQRWSWLGNLNAFMLSNMRTLEMIGVLMRIVSFSLVSWLGAQSPFLFVWIFNSVDAALLTWCAALRKDAAYTLLNVFWILIGVVGIVRAL